MSSEARTTSVLSTATPPPSTHITNVRVFDGYAMHEGQTVTLTGGTITHVGASPTSSTPSTTVDGTGATLLPGFVESHAHPKEPAHLATYRACGVTAVMELGSPSPAAVAALKAAPGLPLLRSADIPATAPWGKHARFMQLPAHEMPATPAEAAAFVGRRIANGADYIKAVADAPGMDQATLNALASHARQNGLACMVHAASHAPYLMAVRARADMVHHVPLDKALEAADLVNVPREMVAVPTLAAMKAINVARFEGLENQWENAKRSAVALRDAGVPVLAGSDANTADLPGLPKVRFGHSFHDELEFLVEAGLSELEVLRAATVLPARYFGLEGRGKVEAGKVADLVLVEGNPLEDIRNTRKVKSVWIGGVRYTPDQTD